MGTATTRALRYRFESCRQPLSVAVFTRDARKHDRWGWLAINGATSIAAAALAIMFPAATTLAFAFLFAAWAVVSGIANIAAGLALSASHGRWWLIAGGIIAVSFGIWVVVDLELGMVVLSYMVGFHALLAGSTLLALAYRLRENRVADDDGRKAGLTVSIPREARHG